jgi:hypothetical protein
LTPRTGIAALVIGPVFAIACAEAGAAQDQRGARAERQAALTWAVREAPRAFDMLLPAASRHDAVTPVCRIVSLRSGNVSTDQREFRIVITETCNRRIVSAEVVVAKRPLTIQLAEMRMADERLELQAAIVDLDVERRILPVLSASRIIASLDKARPTLRPMPEIVLDSESVEVVAASWGEVRILCYTADTRPGWRALSAAVRLALRVAGVERETLSFDPSDVER